jgi:hypothetical protein
MRSLDAARVVGVPGRPVARHLHRRRMTSPAVGAAVGLEDRKRGYPSPHVAAA